MSSLVNSIKRLRDITPISPKIQEEEILSNSFCEDNITLSPKLDKEITRKKNDRPISLVNINTITLNNIQTYERVYNMSK
jgi:hypothetical protein